MKKKLAFLVFSAFLILSSCGNSSDAEKNAEISKLQEQVAALSSDLQNAKETTAPPAATPESTTKQTSTTTKKTSTFTNKYGTATTKCMQPGCSNYIASSGDTAYCVKHSNKCLECHCYIDGDALYCVSCIEKALSR